MNSASFQDKLKVKWNDGKFVCVGLDSDFEKLPASVKTNSTEDSIFNFNKEIIDKTHDLVSAYKLNSAFYEGEGVEGWKALTKTIHYIKDTFSDIVVILDAKRADIDNTNFGYVKMAFENLRADAITVNPYLGMQALMPFLECKDKGVIVLVKTSNEGSGEFQDEWVDPNGPMAYSSVYELVAYNIATKWNQNGNCAVVVGGTYYKDLKRVREIVGDMPILVPGIGAQGGDLEAVIKNGLNSNKQGLIINSSRGIIFSADPRQAVIDLDKRIKDLIK